LWPLVHPHKSKVWEDFRGRCENVKKKKKSHLGPKRKVRKTPEGVN